MAKLTDEQIAALAEEAAKRKARKAELAAKREDERAKRAGESKADAFKRIGTRRLNNALTAISQIGGLAAPANYEYTNAQVETVLKALQDEVIKLQKRFANPNAPTEGGVTL